MAKTIAYIRVSTDRQDVENQRLEILNLANEKALGRVAFIEETESGRISWKSRALAGVMDELTAGDALVVAELSRLGRSMLEIMEVLSVATQREIRVYAAKGDWHLNGNIQSKMVAFCFAMAAEIERDLISQRTKAALATRKAAGQKLGRPPGPGKSKLDDHHDEILELIELGLSKKRVAAKFSTTPANLWHWMKKRGIEK